MCIRDRPHAARQITVHSPIPTLGIGSGAHTCDGDVVVIHDLSLIHI